MSRTRESGAYLGGIGTMLNEADVCIHCGEMHPVRNFGLSHGERGHCPKVIMGRFPILIDADGGEDLLEEELLVGSASQRIRDYESPPLPMTGSERVHRRLGVDLETRARTMGLPWLPPPDLGTVI
jgi:hypothetical protein